MASNLVKEGVERNSERIFAAIKDSLVDEASVEDYIDSIGIEGYVNSTRLPDGSVRVFLSEERPEDVVQSFSPEEEIPESTGFKMSREELDAGLPGISDDLESIGVLASGDNSLIIGSDSISDDNISLLILSSTNSKKELFFANVTGKEYRTSDIISLLRDRRNTLLSNTRNRQVQ